MADHSDVSMVSSVSSVSYTLEHSYCWLCSEYLVLQVVMHDENDIFATHVTLNYCTVSNMVPVFDLSIPIFNEKYGKFGNQSATIQSSCLIRFGKTVGNNLKVKSLF